MTRYYRVIKDNFLWDVGAILSNENNNSQYVPIEDIWNKFEDQYECITATYIEESPKFFERVYKSRGEKLLFVTANVFRKAFDKFKK